jgi:small-conductance mechanosensitive channel
MDLTHYVPLIRRFFRVFLIAFLFFDSIRLWGIDFVIVSLIILASLGVNIGPLIAGAGVIGLAIGFGAQTLVKDIISKLDFRVSSSSFGGRCSA